MKTTNYKKLLEWWKASNRWKHLLYAIPLGAVCGAHFTTGVGLGMEVKDHLYGGKADFVDFALTAVGGLIGHGVMLAVGMDYLIKFLINLIF
nr:MAG TPA: putative periplasmic lipoprotein [Caudoviricetes sp.]